MPSKSAAQHRLMEAAAHTKGGYGGVPQSVGKEFVRADDDAEGKLEGAEKTEGESSRGKREDQPAHVFLEPGERKYPVKVEHKGEWRYDRDLLLAAAREARMHGHADLAKRADTIRAREFGGDAWAFDRGTVRSIDADGRLHVALTNISKANVCGYYGYEIPDAERLGLDAYQLYQLYRDPEELKAGAATFNNLPLLSQHIAVSAADPQHHLVIGSTGTDAVFDPPYLKNSLVVWDEKAIAAIESGQQKELSCAYRYTPVMEAGEIDGVRYDGRMTNIIGNHVALVETGRAGSDVVVGDSAKEKGMPKTKPALSRRAAHAHGALSVFLKPRLAADAKVDLRSLLAGVTAQAFDTAALGTAIEAATRGKLAKDAKLDDLPGVLAAIKLAADDMIDGDPEGMDEEEDDKDDKDKKASDEDKDDDEDEKKKAKAEDEAEEDDDKDDKKKGMDKKAMDAAIAKAVADAEKNTIARLNAVRAAEDEVLPYVGKLAMAHDSAAEVYKTALGVLGVETKGMHPDAFRPVLLAQPKPGSARSNSVAMDAAAASTFEARFPNAARIRA